MVASCESIRDHTLTPRSTSIPWTPPARGAWRSVQAARMGVREKTPLSSRAPRSDMRSKTTDTMASDAHEGHPLKTAWLSPILNECADVGSRPQSVDDPHDRLSTSTKPLALNFNDSPEEQRRQSKPTHEPSRLGLAPGWDSPLLRACAMASRSKELKSTEIARPMSQGNPSASQCGSTCKALQTAILGTAAQDVHASRPSTSLGLAPSAARDHCVPRVHGGSSTRQLLQVAASEQSGRCRQAWIASDLHEASRKVQRGARGRKMSTRPTPETAPTLEIALPTQTDQVAPGLRLPPPDSITARQSRTCGFRPSCDKALNLEHSQLIQLGHANFSTRD